MVSLPTGYSLGLRALFCSDPASLSIANCLTITDIRLNHLFSIARELFNYPWFFSSSARQTLLLIRIQFFINFLLNHNVFSALFADKQNSFQSGLLLIDIIFMLHISNTKSRDRQRNKN